MKVLCVSGFTEKVGDGSPFWEIADALDALLPDPVTRRQWDTLVPDDIAGHDVIVTYSYGQAALWHAMYALDEMPRIQQLFIIAGVPRFWFGQFYGSPWHITANIAGAEAFNVDSVPHSAGIHNPSSAFVNVDCDGPGVDHVSIQGLQSIRDRIVAYVSAAIGSAAASAGAAATS
jgi:hypothetical protein